VNSPTHSGSEQRFLRVLARRDVLALAFGAMVGWGWVILVGNWILRGGSLGAMWGFLIAGGAVVIIALIYGELVSAMPEAGGEHVYSLRALGHGGSFVCTWAIISGYVSVANISCRTSSMYCSGASRATTYT